MKTLSIILLLVTSYRPGNAQESTWKTFSPQDGSFSVLLPDKPTENKQSTDTAAGTINSFLFSSTDSKSNVYMVGYTDYPEANIRQTQPDKIFNAARDRLIATEQGRLLNESTISLEGHPGRAFSVEMPGGLIVKARLYLIKNRFYQLLAETKRIKDQAETIEAFFGSFKIAGGEGL